MTDAPEFLAITGPTASGKTDLSLAIAERVPAEVISMDSRQVYAGMDIGTDKVPPQARIRVPHHGLDLVTPDRRYSAGHFARDARRWISLIRARRRIPLVVGGTGFFLRALTDPIFAEPPMDPDRVERLRAYLRRQDRERLARWVERLDPERAPLAVQGGAQRMSRTLEVALLTGRPLSWWHRNAEPEAPPLHGVITVLELPREEMDRRIDRRVDRMVERGLVEEVRRLSNAGYGADDPGMTGTGYREILRYLDGTTTLEEAMEEIRHATRRYARRQLTWFRTQLPDDVVRVDAMAPLDAQVETVLEAWARAGGTP